MAEKPTPPGEYECCDSGCEPCVWDIYYDELRAWQQARRSEQPEAESNSQPDTKTFPAAD